MQAHDDKGRCLDLLITLSNCRVSRETTVQTVRSVKHWEFYIQTSRPRAGRHRRGISSSDSSSCDEQLRLFRDCVSGPYRQLPVTLHDSPVSSLALGGFFMPRREGCRHRHLPFGPRRVERREVTTTSGNHFSRNQRTMRGIFCP